MRRELAIDKLRSLAWKGDELVDWISGFRITLEGNVDEFGEGDTYRFDAAVGLGDLAIAYETLGTKARVMQWNGELPEAGFIPLGYDELRELDRSYYEATTFAYPVCLLTLPDGRPAIAHCPRRYDTLELELVTGKALTKRKKKPVDIFHSRLAASPDGRWLLSNGWIWHPMNTIAVYDVAKALAESAHLSTSGIELDLGAALDGDVDAAALSGDRVLVGGSAQAPALAVVELPSGKNLASIALDEHLGTRIMAWGKDHLVAFDGRPRVISLADGSVVHRFAELDAGRPVTQPSANMHGPVPPFLAIDPTRARFALGAPGRIIVISED